MPTLESAVAKAPRRAAIARPAAAAAPVRRALPAWTGTLGRWGGQGLFVAALVLFLALPLLAILVKAVAPGADGAAGVGVLAGIVDDSAFLGLVWRSLAVGRPRWRWWCPAPMPTHIA